MSSSPPGWRTDPLGRYEHRYWDGSEWTDQVSNAGQPGADPPGIAPTPAAEPAPSAIAPGPQLDPANVAKARASNKRNRIIIFSLIGFGLVVVDHPLARSKPGLTCAFRGGR